MTVRIRVAGDRLTLPSGRTVRCAIGRSGYSLEKREGDGATPIGIWPVRHLYLRRDRMPQPQTALSILEIGRDDGWCDDPGDPAYNCPVKLPYRGRHEELWREDALYDLIVVLGYNDDPVAAGKGSAIFMHIARPDYGPTEGCVAMKREDLVALVATLEPGSDVEIVGPAESAAP